MKQWSVGMTVKVSAVVEGLAREDAFEQAQAAASQLLHTPVLDISFFVVEVSVEPYGRYPTPCSAASVGAALED